MTNNNFSRTRRAILGALAGMPVLAGCATQTARGGTGMNLTLTGQALMKYPLCAEPYAGFDEIVQELGRGDATFTDLEVAIKTPASGAPTRDTIFLHTTSPAVLDCLKAMNFDLLALANNHAWDLGTPGIMATRNAVLEHGFAAAGSGANAVEASRAGLFRHAAGDVALVAMATERLRGDAPATADRAGVNELRLVDGAPHPDDAARTLAAIRAASQQADVVIAYHHNHDWGDDMRITRPWSVDWAHDCIDAGANLYVSHGAPLLHGIEIYRGCPIFYGLGSLVFHSRTDIGHYPPEVWESAIVHVDFDAGHLRSLEIIPVVLNEVGDDPARQGQTRGRPRIAEAEAATRILERLDALSRPFGTALEVQDSRATLLL